MTPTTTKRKKDRWVIDVVTGYSNEIGTPFWNVRISNHEAQRSMNFAVAKEQEITSSVLKAICENVIEIIVPNFDFSEINILKGISKEKKYRSKNLFCVKCGTKLVKEIVPAQGKTHWIGLLYPYPIEVEYPAFNTKTGEANMLEIATCPNRIRTGFFGRKIEDKYHSYSVRKVNF